MGVGTAAAPVFLSVQGQEEPGAWSQWSLELDRTEQLSTTRGPSEVFQEICRHESERYR